MKAADTSEIKVAAPTGLRAARLHWLLGVRFAIACGAPPILGVATQRPLAGVIASMGALFPMLADIGGNIGQRLSVMAATSIFMTGGLAVGAITAGHFWTSLPLIAAAAFAAAWVSDLHRVLELGETDHCCGYGWSIPLWAVPSACAEPCAPTRSC